MDSYTNEGKLFSIISEMFSEKIPFNKLIGLRVESIQPDCVKIAFEKRDELVGHYTRGTLHGGVISSVIDVTGGLSAFMSIQEKLFSEPLEKRLARFAKVNTIDLRVDFLRPGLGKWFVASAFSLRTGKKVAVTRIELHNDQHELIAVGTGSYVVA
jgi:uncharacterized protein (TIGR00369 family)